jgi:hypothetical protein
MKNSRMIRCSCCILICLGLSCGTRDATVSNSRFSSPALSQVARISLKVTVVSDAHDGLCFLVTMKNTGRAQLTVGGFHQFDEIAINLYQNFTTTNGYFVVPSRADASPTNNANPFSSYRYQFIPPSTLFTWKIPLRRYYNLKPGVYRADLILRVNLKSGDVTYPVTVSTGPIEFNI